MPPSLKSSLVKVHLLGVGTSLTYTTSTLTPGCAPFEKSRSFDLNAYAVDQNDKELPYLPGLVPFIDLCNHNFDASIKISVERRKGERAVIARATKDLRKGDELCLNYHGSLQEVIHYLFYYGFVPNVNRHREVWSGGCLPLKA